MKLSELKGERAIEVVADLIEPISNIVSDQKNLKFFQAEQLEGESPHDMAVRDLKEKIPLLLRTHKKDILAILCTINNVSPDDISLTDMIKGVADLINDEEFKTLFLSVPNLMGSSSPTESSATAEHTEPES